MDTGTGTDDPSVPFYPGDFYHDMEKERLTHKRNIPTRQNYIPIYIVSKIKTKVVTGGHGYSVFGTPQTEPSIHNYFFVPSESKSYIKNLLKYGVVANKTPGMQVDRIRFRILFTKEIECPQLELLWLICSKYKLFTLSSYLLHLNPIYNQLVFFMDQFVELAFNSSAFENEATKKRTLQIIQDFLPEFITYGCMKFDNDQSFVHAQVDSANDDTDSDNKILRLHKTSREILDRLIQRLIETDCPNRNVLLAIIQSAPVTLTNKKAFYSWHLGKILQEEAGRLTSEDILRSQEKYAGHIQVELDGKSEVISMLIGDPFCPKDVLQLIKSIIQSSDVHWENVLLTIRLWERKDEDPIFSLLKEYIRDLLSEALGSQRSDWIASAFILARHCSLISPQKFSRYEKWYTSMFEGESSTVAKNPEAFKFLVSVLKGWVPNEPVCFLQVHATYWPYIPNSKTLNLRSEWNDYVTQSKVRISEYRELEEIMELDYEPNPNNPVQYDVEMAIKSFENSKKIPTVIAQMLMFKKKYYVEHFLPALLKKPAGIPQTDGRLCLIEALNADGKIPIDLYVQYKKAQGRGGNVY